MAIGGAATVSMALGATLINFVDYRFIFAAAATVLLAAGTRLWRGPRKRRATTTTQPTDSQPRSYEVIRCSGSALERDSPTGFDR